MRESGIEWIGKVPDNWVITKIKYFFDCYDGKRKPVDSSERKSGPYPYWGAGSITDYVDNYLFDEELILLGEDGAPFFDNTRPVAFLINERIWVNNHIHVLKPHKTINSRFLVHWLNNVDYKSYINGSILNKLTQSNMNSISLALPPLEKQKCIADFLDKKVSEIDSVIAKTKVSIEEFKKLKQSIITEAVTKGLNSAVVTKDSGVEWIGNIPKGWNIVRFKYLHNGMNTGEGIDRIYWSMNDEGKPFYTAGLLPIKTTYESFPKEKYTRDNDLLLSRNGTPYIFLPAENALYTDHIIRAKIKTGLNRDFIRYALQQSISSVVVDSVSLATWSASLWNEQLITWPPAEEQNQIVKYLDSQCLKYDAIITKKEKAISELEKYKRSLIYEYVTGKKEVA